ncbi:uncharacterized protein LOC126572979 [Anopheles aquasalis]|uniref:uncharacterized protein LOC126572979 n=1 Tax=Anopheles aquasalis TaxID=42839 RepID=UPI00215AB979|nr:uncharacterized protein LOC126572979 [Anopheles aquasalis]
MPLLNIDKNILDSMRNCIVLIEPIETDKLKTVPSVENVPRKRKPLQSIDLLRLQVVLEPLPLTELLGGSSLKKRKKEPIVRKVDIKHELEDANKLSMMRLIQEYEGKDPDEFLAFCSNRMQRETCTSATLLTIEQADTDLWHELRKGRITASRMHEASRCTVRNGSLTNKIMGLSSGFSLAMKRGTELEGQVLAELQKEFPSLRPTGLVLDPAYPWMGASPDGIADEFVLEIKCPYTPKTYACYVDVTKLSKKYFAQIQLQMHMTHRTKALLGVAALDFETTKKVSKVWIDYDKEYVANIMEDSLAFWREAVFKAMLRKFNRK